MRRGTPGARTFVSSIRTVTPESRLLMQQIRVLSAADVRSAVDMPEAIDAMREAFASVSSGDAVVPVRVGLDSGHGVHLFMPSLLRRAATAGVKVVSVNPGNAKRGIPAVHAVVLLLDPETGRALAIMDGNRRVRNASWRVLRHPLTTS